MPEGIQISPQPSEVGSVSVGNVVRKFIGKTVAPTVNDDITSGYIVSDIWIDETGDNVYVCVDNTDGAAVWNLSLGSKDVDDTPVDGATTVPISSNWAFDHDADEDAHHVRNADTDLDATFKATLAKAGANTDITSMANVSIDCGSF